MFTFSFGSTIAYAATTAYGSLDAEQKAAVGKAIDYMYNQFSTTIYDEATKDGITVQSDSNSSNTVGISAESFAKVKDGALEEVKTQIEEDAKAAEYNSIASSLTTMDTAVLAYNLFNTKNYYTAAKLKEYLDDQYDGGTVTARTFELLAAQAEVMATYDEAVKLLNLVNLDAYSTTSPDTSNSYYDQAKAARDAKLDSLYGEYVAIGGTYAVAKLDSMSDCKTAIEAIDTATELGLKEETYAADTSIKTGYYLINNSAIKTIADETASATTDAANEAVVKANVAANVATFLNDHKTVAGAEDLAEAYSAMYSYLAKYYVGKNLPAIDYSADALRVDSGDAQGILDAKKVEEAYTQVSNLEALAAKLKAEKDADGKLVRDAAEVDKILKGAISDIYTAAGYYVDSAKVSAATKNTKDSQGAAASYTYDTAYTALTNSTVTGDAAKLAFDKAVEVAALKDALEAAIDEDLGDYYALEAEQVKAACETAIAAIEAAASAKDITAAENTLEKAISVIKDKEDVDALFGTSAISSYISAQAANLTTGVAYKNSMAGVSSWQDAYILDDTIEDKLVEYYIEKNARTLAEVKALADEAGTAVVAALPTNATIAAAKKAAEDAIKALPTTITSANKNEVANVLDLIDAYEDLGGETTDIAGQTGVSAKVTAVVSDLQREAYKAYTLADKNDKAALDAVQDLIDESNDFIKRKLDDSSSKVNVPALETALTTLRTTDKTAVQEAIDALPINITEADKATVEAARKLYDDYVAKWQDVETGYYAVDDIDARDLVLAEAVLGLNDNSEADAKAYVQDLKIKARSVKTSKGIKVTINADVKSLLDDGFTVEYKFYRSTKSNKNFGTAKIVKTENTYLNTSGTKGTKYYYKAKLVVKNAKGEVVATTPLTQCLYASRTF